MLEIDDEMKSEEGTNGIKRNGENSCGKTISTKGN